ncbi:RNA polymerase sigma factor, region 3/4 [Desulfitobacterium hafniense]|uniref:RNA polymerase sigma factor, region 3/4 n=1 Tax=Desulfitobacterium hafniense TaxID=49338 RepID=A0A098AW69_DESHA|nr:sigma-70 family RNA polymerase sigma factor [Desulfitobacterium hafniense]CDX00833.1 RNA polymerase sigma factor, region 3/4 [Desulfitobacterium hafniense]
MQGLKVQAVLDSVNKFAEKSDLNVFLNTPSSLPLCMSPDGMTLDEFLNYVLKLSVRIIYISEVKLDEDDFAAEDEDLQEDEEFLSKLESLKSKWSQYLGKSRLVEVMWVYNGVGHIYIEEEDWSITFIHELRAMEEQFEDEPETFSLYSGRKLTGKAKDWEDLFNAQKDNWSALLADSDVFKQAKNMEGRQTAAYSLIEGLKQYGFYVQVPGYGTALQYLINIAMKKIRESEDELIIAYRRKGYTQRKICEITGISERRISQVLTKAIEEGSLNF